MRGVNKVIVLGNATRDAELRHTQSGKPVANMRVATNRTVNGQETAQYHTVVAWDKLAELCGLYVKKGQPIYVEGRLEYRTYKDDEARDRGAVEIIASEVQFLGSRGDAAGPEAGASTAEAREEVDPDDVPL